MLYTASYYQPSHWVGTRYRISRGHPRGRSTIWEKQPYLYPSRLLLTEYQDDQIDFRELDLRYREELEETYESEGGFRDWVKVLAALGDVTMLCFEPAGEPCHRRLAAAWLLEKAPDLQLGLMR